MQKQVGAIMLVAGTCIGSGMIALPMLLAKIGIIPSIILMLVIWFIVYYTSLVNVELNLQAGKGLSLGALGRQFSGRLAELIGTSCFKILSYALMSVYIYGGSSVLHKMLQAFFKQDYAFENIVNIYSIGALILLMIPMKLLDYINRVLFVSLLVVVAILMTGLLSSINWENLPLFAENYQNLNLWRIILPVVFTSFGFQVIFHTLADFCEHNAKMLKKAFFWGSLIPAIVYALWTCSILGAVYQHNNDFYVQMIQGKVEVGQLIAELSSISKWHFVQLLVWVISLLAIITSILGIGIGLNDSLVLMLPKKITSYSIRRIISALLTILPAYIISVMIPNAFIAVLGFAGMILVIIAIILPIYLFKNIKDIKPHYSELKLRPLKVISVLVGFLIVVSQILNIIY